MALCQALTAACLCVFEHLANRKGFVPTASANWLSLKKINPRQEDIEATTLRDRNTFFIHAATSLLEMTQTHHRKVPSH